VVRAFPIFAAISQGFCHLIGQTERHHPLKDFIAGVPDATDGSAMILMTQSQLLELVEELRGMAAATPMANVRDALTRMADRYATRAAEAGRLRGHSTDYTGAPVARQTTHPQGSVASNAPAS
jgi:hypothetical protein